MANASTFIRLSSSVLLEYVYTDISNPGTDLINTASAGFNNIVNGYTEENMIFSDDGQNDITGNTRDRSAVLIDTTTNRFAHLNIDKVTPYQDFDDQITNTASMPIGFTANYGVIYDTVKLHLVQGFNFEGNAGMLFELFIKDADQSRVGLASLVYRSEDNFETMNSAPFILGGKYYSNYIEIKVPSSRHLVNEWIDEYVNLANDDILSYKVTGGTGPQQDTKLYTSLGFYDELEVISAQEYFHVYNKTEVILSQQDQFSTIGAHVGEAVGGDYIEHYATHNGDIIENYLTALNNAPNNDYVIIHDLTIFEQIGATYIETEKLEIAQSSDFGVPMRYRPVIKNPTATAFRIDYVVRLFNQEDSSQIWKTGSMVSTNPYIYGPVLARINLGINPVQVKVYNEIVEKSISIDAVEYDEFAISEEEKYARYVTSFLENNSINVSPNNMYLTVDENGDNVLENHPNPNAHILYGQGMCRIIVNPFDTYIKFTISKSDGNGELVNVNLSSIGNLALAFVNNSGDSVSVDEYDYERVSRESGETVFKITGDIAKKILSYKDRSFYIIGKTTNGDESSIYTGQFFSSQEFIDDTNKQLIDDLRSSLNISEADLSNANNELTATANELSLSNAQITSLEEKNSNLARLLGEATEGLSESVTTEKDKESRRRIESEIKANKAALSRNTSGTPKPAPGMSELALDRRARKLKKNIANSNDSPYTT